MIRKFIVYSLSFIVFVFVFTIYDIRYTIYAFDSTPSADIKAKLEELKKEIASKAAKLKQEINKKLQNKAFVGKVKVKSGNSLTLAVSSGPKIVSLNQDTVFESKVRSKKLSSSGLAVEDNVASLGDVDETGVLTAKKVILLPQSKAGQPLAEKTYFWGQIIAISEKLVTIKDRSSKNIAVTNLNLSEVKLNDFVILTGTKNKNDIFNAEFVYVIPQGGFIKPKKTATPSAQPKR